MRKRLAPVATVVLGLAVALGLYLALIPPSQRVCYDRPRTELEDITHLLQNGWSVESNLDLGGLRVVCLRSPGRSWP